ncbi:MAG TPA: endonuclease/exonuclease/phosphatase family protein [bacterium]|nr:endonuclease/exonuclease/phosphatase family protein [bacterium]
MRELIDLCRQASELLARDPLKGRVTSRLKKDGALRRLTQSIEFHLHRCGEVYRPEATRAQASEASRPIKAMTWNIERGKRFETLVHVLSTHTEMKDADVFFLTEVDWGMARSGNRNVAADLGKSLGLFSYFAPSYFNLTAGHGSERHIQEPNAVGLHGKAILSRYPLTNLRVAAMTNATDKFKSKEVRVGQKRSLIGDLSVSGGKLTVACVHLDAFSSPRMRAFQFQQAVGPLLNGASSTPALIAGDWNTNTMNSTSGRTLFASVLRQILSPGPKRMISAHHAFPQKKFDRPLFEAIRRLGLDYENFNEEGAGTFDLVTDDRELGQMAKDQFPEWMLRWINRIVKKSGGRFSLKLDWFAARGLTPLLKKVIRLRPGEDYPPDDRPSDHHPILLSFEI